MQFDIGCGGNKKAPSFHNEGTIWRQCLYLTSKILELS